MASRKEEKERLREERLEAERRSSSEARKRLMLGYIVAGILAVAVVGGVIVAVIGGGGSSSSGGGGDEGPNVNTLYGILPKDIEVDNRTGTPPPEIQNGDLNAAADAAKCDLQLGLPDEGNTHVTPPVPASLPKYGTNPPTSGNHYPTPIADGAFLNTPPVGNFLHAIEHGRIEIQYSPDLSEEDQLALKGVFDSDRPGMIMFPNPDMPYDVATTAWTNLMGCKTFEGDATLDAIRDFRDEFRGRGPEAIAY